MVRSASSRVSNHEATDGPLSFETRPDGRPSGKGLIAGTSLMSGALIAKRFVLKLEPAIFRLIMDAIMIAAGLAMLWTAATA